MARIPRIVIADTPHHVTHRGNSRKPIFYCDEDRRVYLRLLRRFSMRHDLGVWGYCLMDNHVHLVVVPRRAGAMSKTMKICHQMYAQYMNTKRLTCGHFWENRYYSCPLDRVHRWTALAYVERNPVAAGIVAQSEEYPWSSAQAHAAGQDRTGLLDLGQWSEVYTADRWMEVLRSSVSAEADAERVREATRGGMPLGDEAFIAGIEAHLQRPLPRAREMAAA